MPIVKDSQQNVVFCLIISFFLTSSLLTNTKIKANSLLPNFYLEIQLINGKQAIKMNPERKQALKTRPYQESSES